MQKYEVSREIYNPCAGIYNFDMNFEEEETSLQLDQKRLVKKPGFEILLFDIDDVSFSVENDFVYIYSSEPDHTMHDFGINHENVKTKIKNRAVNFFMNNTSFLFDFYFAVEEF